MVEDGVTFKSSFVFYLVVFTFLSLQANSL